MNKSTFLILASYGLSFMNLFFILADAKTECEDNAERVDIIGCDPINLTYSHKLSKSEPNMFEAVYTFACPHDEIKYNWEILDDDSASLGEFKNNPTKHVLQLEPFFFKTGGIHAVAVQLDYWSEGDLVQKGGKFGCTFELLSQTPIAVINGGDERVVNAQEPFLMNASESIDLDMKSGNNKNLIFKWSCVNSASDFCSNEYDGQVLTVPQQYAVDGYDYTFTLKVKTKSSDWVTDQQRVLVKSNVVELDIVCEKNCPPASPTTNFKLATYLRIKCLKRCNLVKKDADYKWSVKPDLGSKDKTEFGFRGSKLIIKKEVLVPGQTYEVEVSLENANLVLGRKSLKVAPVPKINSCQISPSKGVEVTTKFAVSCSYTGNVTTFEIFTRKKNLDLQLIKGPDLSNLTFILESDPKVFVRIIDANKLSDEKELVVQVDRLPNVNTKDLLKTYTSMVKGGRLSAAVQMINTLVGKVNVRQKRDILEQFNNATITSYEEAVAVAAVTSKLTESAGDTPDTTPEDASVAVVATNVCKKSAQIGLDHVKNASFPRSINYTTTVQSLIECGRRDIMKVDPVVLEPPRIFNITTTFPPLPMKVITENYPDYTDDIVVVEQTEKYKEAASNLVSICETNAKAMTLTVAEGENAMIVQGNASSVAVLKWDGDMADNMIELKEVQIDESLDLAQISSVVLQVCVWTENFLWWSPSKLNISTSIVFVKLESDQRNLQEFVDPLKISLITDESKMFYQVYQVDVFDEIPDIRVTLQKNEHFYVQFYNLTDSDSVELYLSHYEKPNIKKLPLAKVIKKHENVLFVQYEHNYNGWQYIYMKSNLKKYWISVYSLGCYSWDQNTSDWTFACRSDSKSNRSIINCECNHLSVLSGIVHNTPIQIENRIMHLDFELVPVPCSIIFLSLATVFSLYCILVVVFKRKSLGQTAREIFFLGDIAYSARFSYLVVVKTGSQKKAGTSSNVCMYIVGELATSMRHVLNYPDPEHRLLRRNNEDWFVLASEHYLGNLTEITLWFCERVTIYDLQASKEYQFQVLQWLKLPPDGSASVTIPLLKDEDSSRPEVLSKRQRCWKWLNSRKTKRNDISMFTHLTLDLSAICTIFVMVLIMFGMPKFELNDCFAPYYSYKLIGSIFLFGFASSVLSFLWHILLFYAFKMAHCKRIQDDKWFIKFETICWTVLTIYLVALFTVLLVFGFWLPYVISLLWLTSIGIGVLFYLVVLKQMFRLIKIRCDQKEVIYTPLDYLPEISKVVEYQRQYLFKMFGDRLLRPFFGHLYSPLDSDGVIYRRKRQQVKRNLLVLLEDIIMFCIYILLLYLVIYANREPLSSEIHRECLALIDGTLTRTDGFDDIGNVKDLYSFINETLIIATQSAEWYWKYVVVNPGMTIDFAHKYLGVARVRQHRVIKSSCKIPGAMKSFFRSKSCKAEFYKSEEETDNLSPNITRVKRLQSILKYTGITDHKLMVIGKFGVYKGAGYVSPLGRTIYNSYVNLKYLERAYWIDSSTRSVIIEFLLYNANINLFTSVRILVEMSASGFILTEYDIHSARLLYINDEEEVAEVVLFLAFMVVVAFLLFKTFLKLFKIKVFLKDRWSFVDVTIVTLSITCFCVFVYRMQLVKEFLSDAEHKRKNEFVSYFHLFHCETILKLVAAILIFVATIRLWKLLRFATTFKVMETTMTLSFYPIMAMVLCHVIVLLAFGFAAHMVFINESEHFKDLPDTFVTMILVSIGMHHQFDVGEIMDNYPIATQVYYTFYMILSLLLFTVYVAVVMIYYYEARKVHSGAEDFQDFKQFIQNEFRYYMTLARVMLVRMKGGSDQKTSYVTSKDEEHRYENCRTLSSYKLMLISYIVKFGILRTKIRNTLQRESIMKQVSVCVLRMKCDDDEDERFFVEREERDVKVISDRKLVDMERVVMRMFDDGEKRKARKRKYNLLMEYQKHKLDVMDSMLASIANIVNNIDFSE